MKPNGRCKAHAAVNNISRNEHHPTVESKDPTRGSRRVERPFFTEIKMPFSPRLKGLLEKAIRQLERGGGDDTIHVLAYRIRHATSASVNGM
ncbi:hypothetical protein GQ457_06G009960 [Hibiscus cannabinus]